MKRPRDYYEPLAVTAKIWVVVFLVWIALVICGVLSAPPIIALILICIDAFAIGYLVAWLILWHHRTKKR